MASKQEEVVSLTKDLFKNNLLDVTDVESEEIDENTIRINIQCEEPAVLIGRNGETLFALQHIIRLLAKKQLADHSLHIIVDIDNYRKGQEDSIATIARNIATRVRQSGIPYEFPPMMAYKRRAVHTYFTAEEHSDLKVFSVGQGSKRRVRVELKDPKQTSDTTDIASDLDF
jgi:spoIIIJ-associated protein